MKFLFLATLIFSISVNAFANEQFLAPGKSGIVCGDSSYDIRSAIDSLNWFLSTASTEYSELYVKTGCPSTPGFFYKVVSPFDVSAPSIVNESAQFLACVTVTKR